MLRTRLWTALVGIPATLVIILFVPPQAFRWIIALLTAWGLYEVAEMSSVGGDESFVIALVGGASAGVLLFAHVGAWPQLWITAAIVVLGMLVLVARVAKDGADSIGRGLGLAFLGALWVGMLFPYFALLRNQVGGADLLILMLLLVMASDSGAYFAGRRWGERKLLPSVSPNKTVEGALGGLAACIAAGIILRTPLVPRLSWVSIVILAVLIGVLAQLGDLASSAFKRAAGVKDSGWIFPGHGGLLDRTCSLVFAAALTYYYAR
ncbi:MAG: phosphatidate cytidylyltransferase [Candidatus Binataceae bacterium]